MGFSLEVQSDSWLNDDQSWCAARMGRTVCRSITLDISLFNALHYVNGFIPSGTVLAKVTATGLYGPYSPLLVNGLQTPLGHLYTPVRQKNDVGTAYTKQVGSLFWMGIVDTTKLPVFTGGAALLGALDAAAKTALSNYIRYEP